MGRETLQFDTRMETFSTSQRDKKRRHWTAKSLAGRATSETRVSQVVKCALSRVLEQRGNTGYRQVSSAIFDEGLVACDKAGMRQNPDQVRPSSSESQIGQQGRTDRSC